LVWYWIPIEWFRKSISHLFMQHFKIPEPMHLAARIAQLTRLPQFKRPLIMR